MKTIWHHGCDESKASAKTQEVRRTHQFTAQWISTTQVWSWKGGDAIVVMTNTFGRPNSVVVLRIGDKVHVVTDASVNSAMKAYGLEGYDRIRPGSEKGAKKAA